MTYGQITETEARTRGLTPARHSITDQHGTTRYWDNLSGVYWIATTDLPDTRAPAWHGGMPLPIEWPNGVYLCCVIEVAEAGDGCPNCGNIASYRPL